MTALIASLCRLSAEGSARVISASPVLSIAAIGTSQNKIEFFMEHGESAGASVSCSSAIHALAWSPVNSFLVAGTADGSIYTVSYPSADRIEEKGVHSAPVSLLQFSQNGEYFLSGDEKGTLLLWKVEPTGKIMQVQSYQRTGKITHAVFASYSSAPLPQIPEGIEALESMTPCAVLPKLAFAPGTNRVPASSGASFFFGTDSGCVSFGDSAGAIRDIVPATQQSVQVLEYSPTSSKLLVVFESQLISSFWWSWASGKVIPLYRAKVPSTAENQFLSSALVPGDVVVTASSEENFIRCWSLKDMISGAEGKVSYILASSFAGTVIPKSEKFTALHYAPDTAILTAGTLSGSFYQWKWYDTYDTYDTPDSAPTPTPADPSADPSAPGFTTRPRHWMPLPPPSPTQVPPTGWTALAGGGRGSLLCALGSNRSCLVLAPQRLRPLFRTRYRASPAHAISLTPVTASSALLERWGVAGARLPWGTGDRSVDQIVLAPSAKGQFEPLSAASLSDRHVLLADTHTSYLYKLPTEEEALNLPGTASPQTLPHPEPLPVRAALLQPLASYPLSSPLLTLVDEYLLLPSRLATAPKSSGSEAFVAPYANAHVHVYNLKGEPVQRIDLSDVDGAVTHIQVAGHHVALLCSSGVVKLYGVTAKLNSTTTASTGSNTPLTLVGSMKFNLPALHAHFASYPQSTLVEDMHLNDDLTFVAIRMRTPIQSLSHAKAHAAHANASNSAPGAAGTGGKRQASPSDVYDASSFGFDETELAAAETPATPAAPASSVSAAASTPAAFCTLDPTVYVLSLSCGTQHTLTPGSGRVPTALAFDAAQPALLWVASCRVNASAGAADGGEEAPSDLALQLGGIEVLQNLPEDALLHATSAPVTAGAGAVGTAASRRSSERVGTTCFLAYLLEDLVTLPTEAAASATTGAHAAPVASGRLSEGVVFVRRVEVPVPNAELLAVVSPIIHVSLPFPSTASIPIVVGADTWQSTAGSHVACLQLKEFSSLEDRLLDWKYRTALVAFSTHCTAGRIQEAYAFLRTFRTGSGDDDALSLVPLHPGEGVKPSEEMTALWTGALHTCLRTGKMEAALECLENLHEVRAQVLLRHFGSRMDKAAGTALLAVQLGLLSVAVNTLARANRVDLQIDLYKSVGLWDRAIALAKKAHPILLGTLYYQRAKEFEAAGAIDEAVEQYMLNDTDAGRIEACRLLEGNRDINEVVAFVNKHGPQHKHLYLWLAQLLEAKGDIREAKKYYNYGQDVPSLVRLACGENNTPSAHAVVQETRDKGGTYHLARYLEAQNDIVGAMRLHESIGTFGHVIRLAGLSNADIRPLLPKLLQESHAVQLLAARFFEKRGHFPQAVALYRNTGNLYRALLLAHKANLHSELLATAEMVQGDSSVPVAALESLANMFADAGLYALSALLLVKQNKYTEALNLIIERRVPLTESLAENLTPPAAADPKSPEGVFRSQHLTRLAETLRKQGEFTLATKKYTQAGHRTKAMQCLVEVGDPEKVIFFATACKNQEVYLLAANFLITQPWDKQPELHARIVEFYLKGRGYAQLSSFFESCASVEIDEYRDYEKALDAMREALKTAERIKEPVAREDRVTALKSKVSIIDRFVMARSLARTSPSSMQEVCHQLLQQKDAREVIRIGDLYALLIYALEQRGDWIGAGKILLEMVDEKLDIWAYLNNQLVTKISNLANIPASKLNLNPSKNVDNVHTKDHEITEEL